MFTIFYDRFIANFLENTTVKELRQESPNDARVTRDSAVIPRWPSAAILDFTEPEIAAFDPPTQKTLAYI